MSFLLALLLLALVAPVVVLLQAGLFRLVARKVGGVEVRWTAAVGTVLVAGLAQSVFTGGFSSLVLGGDVGLCGTIAGFLVWSAAAAGLTDLRFGQAALVGLVMAVAWWAIGVVVLLLLVVTGIAALVGLAGLAL